MLFELKNVSVPRFNESGMADFSGLNVVTSPGEYDDLNWWVKRSPELIRIVSAVVDDVLGEGVFFDGAVSAVRRAQGFWDSNFMKEELKKAIFDWALYGDGYLWKGNLSSEQLEGVRFKSLEGLPERVRHYGFKVDEDSVNFVRHVASTTVSIDLNESKTAISSFRQVVSGESVRVWSPDEVVHGKYWTVEGKVYGFSPARALLVELQTIGFIKDYTTGWFRQGGMPDIVFNFPDEQPGSPRVASLKDALRKYKHPAEKHGNIVSTGKLDVEKLNEFSKEMEFRELLIQITGIIAHAYGLPAGRISAIIGAEVKVSTGSDDLANESYWGMIKGFKDYWQTLLNTQIFSRFGNVGIRFPHTHKVDEVRETQSKLQLVEYLTSLRSLGVDYKMSYVKRLLGVLDDDLKSQVLKPMGESGFGGGRQNLISNEKLQGGGSAAEGREKQKEKRGGDKASNLGF